MHPLQRVLNSVVDYTRIKRGDDTPGLDLATLGRDEVTVVVRELITTQRAGTGNKTMVPLEELFQEDASLTLPKDNERAVQIAGALVSDSVESILWSQERQRLELEGLVEADVAVV